MQGTWLYRQSLEKKLQSDTRTGRNNARFEQEAAKGRAERLEVVRQNIATRIESRKTAGSLPASFHYVMCFYAAIM